MAEITVKDALGINRVIDSATEAKQTATITAIEQLLQGSAIENHNSIIAVLLDELIQEVRLTNKILTKIYQ